MRLSAVLAVVSILAFIACLPLHAFCVAGACSNWQGWSVFVIGGLAQGPIIFLLLFGAIPLLFVAGILLLRRPAVLWFAASALALLTLVLGVTGGYLLWFANPLLFVAWTLILLRRRPAALWFAVSALAFGIAFLGQKTVETGAIGSDGPMEVTGYKEGYWLWLASMAVAVVAAWLCGKLPQPARVEV
jgi:hypothetical protein